ncbi:MAG TPA: hypothetical protein VGP68_18050 [Gemmataceae bacterium]|nr:hypothetical protein [Gemmataceae bacterium]
MFAALEELATVIPEIRVGQILAAVGELCSDMHGRGLWDASDSELREAARAFRRNYEQSVKSSKSGA